MRAAVILVVAAGFALGLVVGTTELVGRAAPPVAQPTSVIWANRIFPSRHDLAVWLTARGSSYQTWAERHVAAARPFEKPTLRLLHTAPDNPSQLLAAPPGKPTATLTRTGTITLVAILAMAGLLLFVRFARGGLALAGVGRPARLAAVHLQVPHISLRSTLPARVRVDGPTKPFVRGRAWGERLTGLAKVARDTAARSLSAASAFRKRRFMRRYFPAFAFYAGSALLAFAVGASIAIFMK